MFWLFSAAPRFYDAPSGVPFQTADPGRSALDAKAWSGGWSRAARRRSVGAEHAVPNEVNALAAILGDNALKSDGAHPDANGAAGRAARVANLLTRAKAV